jgi:hypothetical protein
MAQSMLLKLKSKESSLVRRIQELENEYNSILKLESKELSLIQHIHKLEQEYEQVCIGLKNIDINKNEEINEEIVYEYIKDFKKSNKINNKKKILSREEIASQKTSKQLEIEKSSPLFKHEEISEDKKFHPSQLGHKEGKVKFINEIINVNDFKILESDKTVKKEKQSKKFEQKKEQKSEKQLKLLENKKINDLKIIARDLKIKGYSLMKKEDLVKNIYTLIKEKEKKKITEINQTEIESEEEKKEDEKQDEIEEEKQDDVEEENTEFFDDDDQNENEIDYE